MKLFAEVRVVAVRYTIAVFPHIPRDVEKLQNQLFHPLFASIVQVETVLVCLLDSLPMSWISDNALSFGVCVLSGVIWCCLGVVGFGVGGGGCCLLLSDCR